MERTILSLFLAAVLMAPATAHAYIDPSAGQSLIQILIAVVAAVGVFFRPGLKRIVKLFSRSSPTDSANER